MMRASKGAAVSLSHSPIDVATRQGGRLRKGNVRMSVRKGSIRLTGLALALFAALHGTAAASDDTTPAAPAEPSSGCRHLLPEGEGLLRERPL